MYDWGGGVWLGAVVVVGRSRLMVCCAALSRVD